MGVVRVPTKMTDYQDVKSPSDPNVEFRIKKATNREDVEMKNMFSKVRFISQEDEDGPNFVQERDFPRGDMEVETIKLCLVSWNIESSEGRLADITTNTIKDLLLPEERTFLYEKIIEFNPIWNPRANVKNS